RDVVDLDLGRLKLDDLTLGHLKGELQFTRVADGVLVEGKLKATAEVECIRCLTPFFEPVVIDLEDTIGLPGTEITPERPVRIHEDGWADLSPLVREYAWLGLPVSPVCSPDCRGICPECGGNISLGECTCENNAPVDPRWAALRSLLDESPEM
ncbi:MAG: YceD family protein, partial [Candidatus Micrarchaeota archaeon]